MTTQIFQRGESVPCWAENWFQGSLTNPSQGIKISIWKPDKTFAKYDTGENGEADIKDIAMTLSVTGKYVYYYQSHDDDTVGKWWHFKCVAVDGSGEDAKKVITHGSFKLT